MLQEKGWKKICVEWSMHAYERRITYLKMWIHFNLIAISKRSSNFTTISLEMGISMVLYLQIIYSAYSISTSPFSCLSLTVCRCHSIRTITVSKQLTFSLWAIVYQEKKKWFSDIICMLEIGFCTVTIYDNQVCIYHWVRMCAQHIYK